METVCVVPAKCMKCGSFFDLGYDIIKGSEKMSMEDVLKATALLSRRSLLCWECRECQTS